MSVSSLRVLTWNLFKRFLHILPASDEVLCWLSFSIFKKGFHVDFSYYWLLYYNLVTILLDENHHIWAANINFSIVEIPAFNKSGAL